MASSSNPIAESATISSNYYHVFLNHRGSDVKETLATHLHKRLSDKGLRVFLDKEELQEGDHIPSHLKGAIGSASVHIAIFSPNYAESSWCLNELLLMLESRKTIIPIFYGVKHDVLRWTLSGNGVYARHLSILEGKKSIDSRTRLQKPRYDTNTMEEWRRALSQAADLTGFVVEAEAFNSDDNQLVDKVVERVLKKLPKTPLNVSKYPVGLDNKVKDLEGKVLIMPQQSGETRVVGIVGLGGVGKTTLAKQIFNRERSKYHRSYFLFDVRQKALHSLQRALLKELTGSKVKIESTAEGIEELRRCVSSCHPHALIILDDVDNICQLDALLLPVKDALGSSSLILVTSRNKDVLTSFGIVETSIYKLEGLNPQHSQVLFCSHAFGQPHPAAQFQRVVEEFLDACQGLPLSLQVIGALLHGKDDLRYWKEQLQKISKILPEDIQSILKISYDGLDPEEKEIFLDIACFFTRERGNEEDDFEIRPDTAIKIWDGSGWKGWLGLRNLQNRCLVDVEEDRFKKIEYLRMHDHLRDLGRDLAKKDPLRGHRLRGPTENLLHNLSDQSAVRGLLCLERNQLVDPMRDNRKRRRLELGNRSISMSRLELLRTPGDCLEDILTRVQSPEYLIWLHCHDFPFASLPDWIPMERLRVLYVQGDKLRWLWEDCNSQAPLQLRQLEITARLLKIPKSIGQLKYLEKIVVRPLATSQSASELYEFHKVPLKTLPDEFCDLQCLEHLELVYCSEMKSLPESFGNLKKLQHLDLSGCLKLRTLPNSFRNLKELKHLILICCTGLTISSETLGNITTLELIDMRYSTKIEVLPPQVSHQPKLSELCLTGTNIRKLPSAIGDLRDLKILDIGGPSLEMLPPWLGCLRSLKELVIGDHPWNPKLPDWFYHISNENFSFTSNQLKCLPDSIGELNQLEKLILIRTGVECLPPCIMELNNLQWLEVESSPLREVPFKRDSLVECMLGLTFLSLDSTRISEIAFGKGICPNLQHLRINFCERLAEVGTLPNTLTELRFYYCKTLENIKGLCGLAKLCYLGITGCPKVKELSLGTLKSLDRLWLSGCGGVTGIRGLQQLTKFRDLRVSDCCVLEELAGIEHLIGLRKLYVSGCPNMHCGEEVLKHLCQRKEEGLLDLRYNPLGASCFY